MHPDISHPIRLKRVRNGHDLAKLLSKAEAYIEDYPPLNDMNRDATAELIENIHDYADIWDVMEVRDRIKAEKILGDNISVLDELGLHTYCEIYLKPMNSPEGKWQMSTIVTFINTIDKEIIESQLKGV